ncbi:MAG: aminoglycoside phosphotransferase family protein [Chloroflexi bacterium]|nr:aminoglycoside phosphotransferase family protein [Chloroflexota bacterium]
MERLEVLKYKPLRRCVLGYTLGAQNGNGSMRTQQLIGKVFRDERGQRLLDLQRYLWDNGFGADAPDQIFVPQPLAYIPEMRMLLQERAGGETLEALAQHTELGPFVRRSAEGLAKLHRLPPPHAQDNAGARLSELSPRYELGSERANLNRFATDLIEWRPDAASRIVELHAALDAWAQRLPRAPELLIHRDYYYSQVLFDGARLTLIDFDLLSLGDPAMDVANFTAHLKFMGLDQRGDLDAFSRHAQQFVEAYARYREVDASFWARVEFYAAATLFRLMHVVTPRPMLTQHFDALYDRTVNCMKSVPMLT